MLSGYAATVRDQIDRRAMALLSTGHAAVDFSGGALPALLPFLKTEFGLSYTLVAVLVLASALSSSIVQPLFGLWSDARGAVWLLRRASRSPAWGWRPLRAPPRTGSWSCS